MYTRGVDTVKTNKNLSEKERRLLERRERRKNSFRNGNGRGAMAFGEDGGYKG